MPIIRNNLSALDKFSLMHKDRSIILIKQIALNAEKNKYVGFQSNI